MSLSHSNSDITGMLISNNQQNHSISKQMYSFPKSLRFPKSKNISSETFYYNLPSFLSNRSTSLGYGNKSDFTKGKNNNVPFYKIFRLFDKKSGPRYSFGNSKFNKIKDDCSPGPGKYNVSNIFGNDAPKYSFQGRNKFQNYSMSENFPGPGSYNNNIHKRYIFNSKYINFPFIGFTKESRMKSYNNNIPGPNSYKSENLINGGKNIFNSRFKSNLGRSIFAKHGNYFLINDNPGPGSYDSFSEFGIYNKSFKKKKKKIKKNKSMENIGEFKD